MSKRSRLYKLYPNKLANALIKQPLGAVRRYAGKSRWHMFWLIFMGLFGLCVGGMYGVSQWYIRSHRDEPLVIGTSFIPAYAQSFGLDPKAAMDAMIGDLGVRHFRLVSYWNQLEPAEGTYDFSLLDWQFEKAEKAGAKVTLSLGLRQPRWPECHMPGWAHGTPRESWQPKLERFISEVVSRYKDSPALESYQLENEYYLAVFGECPESTQDRLVSEYRTVKSADSGHPVIISRSNNFPGLPKTPPTPDIYGISVYRRVWSGEVIDRYFTYPMPSWYYAFLAGTQQIATGRSSMLHELQAEAWPPDGQSIQDTSLEEQNRSFDARRFEQYVAFGKDTGLREIYLWGSEYWYYRKVKLHDPSLWNVARETFREN